MRHHTPESIIQTLRSLAGSLGRDTLTTIDLRGVLPLGSTRYYFGSLGAALEAAGLRRRDPAEHFRDRGPTLSDTDLFASVLEVETQLGHQPGYSECEAHGRYSTRPFRKRFGRWHEVLARYQRWRSDTGGRVTSDADGLVARDSIVVSVPDPTIALVRGEARTPQDLYGEPIDFRGLRHAPTNEQGVVYLFGMVSRELGFNVESVRQGFPDCEAKYLHDTRKKLWAKARIEFEFRSSAFLEHGHDPASCDFIVCWDHDWSDCPIAVIELRSEIRGLPNK